MFIGFREPTRRERLHSTIGDKVSRTREHYYSLFTILVVEVFVFTFLWVLFGTAIRVMRVGFRNIPEYWRVVFPAAVAVIAGIIGYLIYKNIKEIVRMNRELERSRKGDSGS